MRHDYILLALVFTFVGILLESLRSVFFPWGKRRFLDANSVTLTTMELIEKSLEDLQPRDAEIGSAVLDIVYHAAVTGSAPWAWELDLKKRFAHPRKDDEEHVVIGKDHGVNTVALAAAAHAVAQRRGWDLSWTGRGAYMHLEVSEFIEAVRGKGGKPLEEAADVLLTLMLAVRAEDLDWDAVERQTEKLVKELAERPHYPGEAYDPALSQISAEEVSERARQRLQDELNSNVWQYQAVEPARRRTHVSTPEEGEEDKS